MVIQLIMMNTPEYPGKSFALSKFTATFLRSLSRFQIRDILHLQFFRPLVFRGCSLRTLVSGHMVIRRSLTSQFYICLGRDRKQKKVLSKTCLSAYPTSWLWFTIEITHEHFYGEKSPQGQDFHFHAWWHSCMKMSFPCMKISYFHTLKWNVHAWSFHGTTF